MGSRPVERTVDFNQVLVWLNAIIAGITVVGYLQVGGNAYIDGETIVLATLLALQTHLSLLVERRRRDPFVILLAFILILYHSLRIFTLLAFPFSFVLDRFAYAPSDSNYALTFILLANAFLYAGLYVVRGGNRLRIEVGCWRPTAPLRALAMVLTTIVILYTNGVLWSADSIPRFLRFIVIFLSQNTVLLMALAYFLLFRKSMARAYAVAFLGLLVLEMVLHSLAGSRSAFIYSLQNILLVLLAANGSIALRRRHVLMGVAMVPPAVILLIASFTISTFIVASTAVGKPFSLRTALETSRLPTELLNRDYALQAGLPVMLSRAGFFDYSAEVIAHSHEYAKVVNAPAYARSVIDNLLTPGFDIFDQPKISNAMRFVYADKGNPSKIGSAEEYQSDQLGIYGELYVLFGYASLPVFFVGAFMFKRAYMALRTPDAFILTMTRVATLFMFAVVVNSFGLDWALFDLLPLVAAIYLYRYFFAVAPDGRIRPVTGQDLTPPSDPRSHSASSGISFVLS